MKSILPITTVSIAIVILWYGFSVVLNSTWTKDQASRAGVEVTFSEILKDTMVQQRPLLPAPHQVIIELWDTTVNKKITSKRSLVYHGWITLSATLLGFVIGTGLGVLLAIGIVHNKAMDYGVMPWIIASQTVPILALAPMIIVVLYSIGLSGLVPKAIISAYLSFFPVSVGMVAGFRCPDPTQMDLLKTYAAKKKPAILEITGTDFHALFVYIPKDRGCGLLGWSDSWRTADRCRSRLGSKITDAEVIMVRLYRFGRP